LIKWKNERKEARKALKSGGKLKLAHSSRSFSSIDSNELGGGGSISDSGVENAVREHHKEQHAQRVKNEHR